METQKHARGGWRTLGRILLSPLTDSERTVEMTARLQQQLIRTDALPEMRRERRAAR